jgi:uncharacterized membrane protein YGL010W
MLPFHYHEKPIYATYFYFFIDFIVLSSIILTKYLHKYKSCNEANLNNKLSLIQFINVLIDSILDLGLAGITFTLISFIPYIGSIIEFLCQNATIRNAIKCILWAFGYILIYIVHNMFEQDKIDEFCDAKNISTSRYIKLILGLILSAICYYNFTKIPITDDLGISEAFKEVKNKIKNDVKEYQEEYQEEQDDEDDDDDSNNVDKIEDPYKLFTLDKKKLRERFTPKYNEIDDTILKKSL